MKWISNALGAPGRTVAAVWKAMLAAAPVKVWAQIGAAMALTVVMVGFGLVIWKGPWLEAHQKTQLDWLGYGMITTALLVLVALAAITGLNVNVRGGRDGVQASIDQDEAQPLAPVVETVTTTTVTPQAPAHQPADGELPASEQIKP